MKEDIANQMQSVQAFKLNIDGDLQRYLNSHRFDAANPMPGSLPLDIYIHAMSEFRTDGLKLLYDSLNNKTVSSIEEVRSLCAPVLLADLEKYSKRKEYYTNEIYYTKEGDRTTGGAPIFQQEFYEELEKPNDERSAELQKFLEFFSAAKNKEIFFLKNGQNITSPEFISTMMLLNCNEEGMTINELQGQLKKYLDLYAKVYKSQVELDLGIAKEPGSGRSAILLKDQDGQTKLIDMDELEQLPTLTDEQKDFIKTSWHQGTFISGYYCNACMTGGLATKIFKATGKEERIDWNMRFTKRESLVIDITTPNEVKLYNRCYMQEASLKSSALRDLTIGVLEVDVSNLQGKSFIPGCAERPKINFYISSLDPKLQFDLPADLPIELIDVTQPHPYLNPDYTATYLEEILAHGPQLGKAIPPLIYFQGEEKAPELILLSIVNSDLDDNKTSQVLEGIIKKRGENFFTDPIKILAAELIAKITTRGEELTAEDKKFIKIAELTLPQDKSYTKEDTPLKKVIAGLNSLTLHKEKSGYDTEELEYDMLYDIGGQEEKSAVQHYVSFEQNLEKQKKFAFKKLEEYLKNETDIDKLDTSTVTRLASTIIAILEPVLKDEEKKKFEKMEELVRGLGSSGGKVLSWRQWGYAFLDQIKDLLSGSTTKQELRASEPVFFDILKNTLRSSGTTTYSPTQVVGRPQSAPISR